MAMSSTGFGYVTAFTMIVEEGLPEGAPKEYLVVAPKLYSFIYVRKNDRIEVEGEIRKKPGLISSYNVVGEHILAKRVKNLTLGIEFR